MMQKIEYLEWNLWEEDAVGWAWKIAEGRLSA